MHHGQLLAQQCKTIEELMQPKRMKTQIRNSELYFLKYFRVLVLGTLIF